MIKDFFVINAVSHAYNMSAENIQPNRYAEINAATILELCKWQPPGVGLNDQHDLLTDWPIDVLAKALFQESQVDMAAHHTLRLDSYFKDGLAAHHKTLEAVTKYPNRFVAYVGLDPTQGLDVCMRELNEQLDEIPDAVGLKMYPAQVEPIRGWRMDDRELMYPIYQRALERGIKTVAVHKAFPLGPVPMNPYRIEDLEGAATDFPELSFEIVHAGLAFVDETALALARYPNVYANLEATMSLLVRAPKLFEEVISSFLLWSGPEKLLYSDGGSLAVHSQPLLDLFVNFELSEETITGLGVPQLDHRAKALILGENYARVIGLDIDAAKKKIADDEFSQHVAANGLDAPYTNWEAALREQREAVPA